MVESHNETKPAKFNADRWIAFGALLASIAAVCVSVASDITQRRHMILSVKPVPSVTFTQTSDDLFVEVRNVGTGPLLLSEISYTDRNGSSATTIINPEAFPTGTSGEIILFELDEPSALAPGESQRLVFYDPEPGVFRTQLRAQALRTALNQTVVQISYSDVYGSAFPTFEHTLISRNIIQQ